MIKELLTIKTPKQQQKAKKQQQQRTKKQNQNQYKSKSGAVILVNGITARDFWVTFIP